MAGDWIKIEHALPGKPEVMQMAQILQISELEVVGHLVCFWSWCDQNLSEECPRVSGTMSGLDRVAGRTGFASAMIEAGWLNLHDGQIEIPNYDDHLSQSAKARGVEAKRKRSHRRKMSHNVRDKTRTKHGQNTGPEKSREEKSIKGASASDNAAFAHAFEDFWNAYPRRNGRRVGKKTTAKWFKALAVPDRQLATEAATNYAASKTAKDGFAKDPERFLKNDFWRDWLEPEKKHDPTPTDEDLRNYDPNDF